MKIATRIIKRRVYVIGARGHWRMELHCDRYFLHPTKDWRKDNDGGRWQGRVAK